MAENDKSRYIVENIIQLSHKLGMTVVAEGVERKRASGLFKKYRMRYSTRFLL